MPYLLSNFDFVTESLTLMAGKSRPPASASWYRRCTPVVVSSVTPLICAAIDGPPLRVGGERAAQGGEDDQVLLGVALLPRLRVRRHRAGGLVLDALVHQQRRVATVVEDHVRAGAAGPDEDLLGALPVLLERLALPREHRHPGGLVDGAVRADDDGRGRLVLRREDVAGRPADLGAERDERLDEHRGLHRHVQGAGDASAGQRLRRAELGAQGHEARHLVLGEADLVPTGLGEGQVADLVLAGELMERR